MVDVNIEYEEYAAFPTMVYKFKLELLTIDHLQMSKWIKRQKKQKIR